MDDLHSLPWSKNNPTSPTPAKEDMPTLHYDSFSLEDSLRRGPPQSDKPGGDCQSLCVRHQRMANSDTSLMLQRTIETLPPQEQSIVNTVWSLFSSSPARRRLLILRGILSIACPSQLSFLQENITLEMRVDPLTVLPREVCLRIFSYLDAMSLGRITQVSRHWKSVADDDTLWKTMCEQHIERKCEKCGWGLPLLGDRSKRRRKPGRDADSYTMTTTRDNSVIAALLSEPTSSRRRATAVENTTPALVRGTPALEAGFGELKCTDDATPSTSARHSPSEADATPTHTHKRLSEPPSDTDSHKRAKFDPEPLTRPWKTVYCERLALERNWRRGAYAMTVLTGHQDAVTCVQVAEDLPHPHFPILMTGSWDRTVRIWNLESGAEIGVLRGHTRGIRALQFDAVKLVTGSMDGTLKIWNWRKGECMRTLKGHADAVLALSYDSQLLVSGSADTTIRVWDFGTGEVSVLRGHTEWVNSVAIWDSNVNDWCGTTVNTTEAASANPEAARASLRGKYVISASDDQTIRVWDLFTRECVRVLTGHVAQVQSLRVIPGTVESDAEPAEQETTACSKEDHQHDRECAVSSSVYNPLVPLPEQNQRTQPALTNVGTNSKPFIVSASLDNTIKVWDVQRGVCERTMFGHIEGVWDVDVDRLRIVSCSHDRTVKIWDRDSGKCLHTLVGHTSAVTAICLKDQYVVTGSDDAKVRVWNFGASVPTEKALDKPSAAQPKPVLDLVATGDACR